MHIPDGFLDVKTFSTFYGISIIGIIFSIKKLKKSVEEKHIPLLGVVSAFIFASQMLNFPVAGGTSGHFMGGFLSAILLGPSAGIMIMSTVLIVQCFVFQDGGLTALGANIFNMGIIGSFLCYYIYKMLYKLFGMNISVFVSSWFTIVLGSTACAIELSISGTVPLKIILPAMVSVHIIIGIAEGIITVIVLGFLSKVRPDLLELEKI